MLEDTRLSEFRVALVDDNRNFQNVLRTILRSFGIRRVDILSEARRFVPHLEQHSVDLAFVDMVMTGTGGSRTSGLDMIAEARHDRTVVNAMMPIVLVTGHASRAVVEAAMLAGADHVLAKPISPQSVLSVLRSLLDSAPRYVKGRDGYFGPDIDQIRTRLKRAALTSIRRRSAEPEPVVAPSRSYLPGMNVPLREDDFSFLD